MRRLKTAPDPWIELPAGPSRAYTNRAAHAGTARWLDAVPRPQAILGGIEMAVSTTWLLVTLPFRAVFFIFGLLGRLAALAIGFSLMVFGAALLAGPLVLVGLPLFAIGLILSMRSLG